MQQAINYLSEKDSIFKTIIEQYGIPVIPSRPQGFETLALLILEQQVSIDSAKAAYLKLRAKVQDFQPQNLISLPDEGYRDCGVSRQKTKYIKCLSEAILDKQIILESLPNKTAQEVREELIKIKGIGNWTIDVYLMFSLQEKDIIPLGDVAVVNTIKELFDIHDKLEMEIYTQKWAPHRSMATFLLWHHYLQKRGRKITYEY
ncbi:MAG: DNA-3-methyladenine glycosylase 2 family protein [Flavobacterium sp.]|uniref:DNA-3-methyladenine glycosylase family protein n=1 Tax=Flavobacterium sp. TaxID=239 RepID=UPI0032631C32